MYYIGLDLHKKTISYCVRDAAGCVHSAGKITSSRRELDAWLILSVLDGEETARQQSVMALAFIGLRRGEICALRWSDIDLAGSTLWVRRSAW